MLKTLLLLTIVLVCPEIVAGQELLPNQELPQTILEEIQVVPAEPGKEWVIGGRTLIVTEQTVVASEIAAETGALAAVQFVEQDGVFFALQIQPLPVKASGISDGPYVFWADSSTAEVVSMRNGKVERKIYTDIKHPLTHHDESAVESVVTLDPVAPQPSRSDWETPNRLMAISDLEGHYIHARQFLQNSGIIDEQGHWIWGDGHLVLVGDLIDRGAMVTELMWLIRRLEREARDAGGQVHYVLGNHEAMVMAGDLRYVHPKYAFVTQRMGISYDQLFSPRSDIGRWWRTKNGILRVGDLLFVHGGYSPMLDEAELDMDTLNQRIRDGLAPALPSGDSPATNPVGHQHGPFWYRGYFDQHAAVWGKASPEEIDRILKRHKVRHIVIGHTVVKHAGPLDDSGAVIAIDVKWSQPDKGEGLLQEDGKLWRVTMSGERQELNLDTRN